VNLFSSPQSQENLDKLYHSSFFDSSMQPVTALIDSDKGSYRASRDAAYLHDHSPKPLSKISLIKLGLRQ
jgi:hypothetical protein